ncbi:MAG: hypothetical protein KGP28_00820 [Bdellovibrionales bacterium]|nr:hypothetical protein [Bdellovibrionales bacterium]
MKTMLSLTAFLFLTACATTGMNSGTGTAFINMETTEAVTATAHKLGTKTGTACSSNILGIYASGDASVHAAAKAGGITNITSIDKQFTNYAFVYGKMCTIVTGN